MAGNRGVTLVEILIALVIIVVAAIGTLGFFAHGLGSIEKQGNRRAALEVARTRVERLMVANLDDVRPPDGNIRWLTLNCVGGACTWSMSATEVAETVTVNGVAGRRMVTTARWADDPAAQTGVNFPDVLDVGVRVWYSPDLSDDEYHRVHLRSLRK